MENESNKPLQQEIRNQERPTPSIIPEGQFRFEPMAEMFETPEENFNDYLLSSSLAADDISGVNEYKADIDKYGIGAMASLGVGVPSFATDTYNPITQDIPKENDYTKVKNILTLDPKPFVDSKITPVFFWYETGSIFEIL